MIIHLRFLDRLRLAALGGLRDLVRHSILILNRHILF
jgi:hypothetical protein